MVSSLATTIAMDSSFESATLDSSKCSKLSMEEKRELVYEISCSHGASEMLQSWSRQEILQILCAEMGKERKYTGLTKLKIIENLLKIVSEKKSGGHETVIDLEQPSSPALGQKAIKRQRKTDHPSRLSAPAHNLPNNDGGTALGNTIYCKNSACRATLIRVDEFCKRCSCCICYRYDDNKDPSLWLICSSDPPFHGSSCGMSCHLECALKHERSGISKDGRCAGLDGSFNCVSCGKVNDLLGCWRKQLMTAKETRRVDILCYRVSLSQKLLKGTEKYQKVSEIVDEAVRKLEADVGPLTGLPVRMGRGIVNRLSSGPEVQKLCGLAVESLDSLRSDTFLHPSPDPVIQESNSVAPNIVRFGDIHATSLTVILGSDDSSPEDLVGYTLWHRKAHDVDYPAEPTCKLVAPNTKFVVTGLTPATEYSIKVVSLNGTRNLGMYEVCLSTGRSDDEVLNSCVRRSQSPATNCSSLSNPSSVEDETNNITPYSDQADKRADNYLTYCKDANKFISVKGCDDALCSDMVERNPADLVSVLDEEHALQKVGPGSNSDVLELENKNSQDNQITEDISTDDGSNSPVQTGKECVPFVSKSEAGLPTTPCKLEVLKDGVGRSGRSKFCSRDLENGIGKVEEPQDGSTSKKRSMERRDGECAANGISDRDFEYYVKLIRWLECEGHVEKNFRQKFLTWYGLRATPQEVRIVKVFVDTFLEDPACLAEQLVDTFSESISSKRSSVVPAGFCMKLWH
ncbi:hypothetical protein I3760_07G190400 [Carya illinoinensis]|uniref:Fibronectin type-III domain-containing protein n=1 Tax=Carya illinoinensis TaxID=32201 RepID=A0A8T1Q4Q8_CARIL|nr:VIN3-like protein 2 [Carya illinoinensis]XP_042986999.1 VIN3-like protein 2 [Carya illinoinensis]KAG2699366.1 hypothetical protein I3760_07G190400 [Carya illinoinensis]KAG2699367.1 hypothetical protein I3760_07G190400 [Carya illinoinensis]KAG2699368.1 hypothetical protein I3760_07G190400 [Carya illinoinensis]KAG2699369.1 hypothetical protein I3760_07G190400 [Carya illinoinensis]KAG2699370.1 hypothetical protein I3760_07G190400 [Carya illinoinensis]